MPRTDWRSRATMLGATLSLVASTAGTLRGQRSVLLQGIADAELWSTNTTSNFLTRNDGDPSGLARLQVWGAVEPISRLVLYAQGEVAKGSARAANETRTVYSDQFGIRYSASRLFVIDAGRLTPVIGTFAPRHFSTRNPLIGEPDGYSAEYPLGVEVFGESRRFDYRVAMVSLPSSHLGYVPVATPRLRPAIGAGITPFVGLRLGASFTTGSYLNRSVADSALKGKRWSDFRQRVIALDASFSRGYLETHAEAARGAYDTPGGRITGFTYYGEAKYTLSPRFFVAARAERNKYPFIRPNSRTWTARLTDFVDGEFGGGYRASASTLLKASIRGDRWWVRTNAPGFRGKGGYAIALQLSQSFDVIEWIDRGR